MKIELKKISYNASLSEETAYYSANIWVDGKYAGFVRNHGHGGSDMIEPWELKEKLDKYAQTLPEIDCSGMYRDGGIHLMQQCAETLLGGLLEDHLQAKQLKSALARQFVFINQKGEVRTAKYGKLKPAAVVAMHTRPVVEQQLKDKFGATKVLNFLPESEALVIWKTAA